MGSISPNSFAKQKDTGAQFWQKIGPSISPTFSAKCQTIFCQIYVPFDKRHAPFAKKV
jgi:hypothetical protein